MNFTERQGKMGVVDFPFKLVTGEIWSLLQPLFGMSCNAPPKRNLRGECCMTFHRMTAKETM